MSQQQSPWLETAYGWAYGESGWNTGMDSNLLKFSVLFDRNVDSIVASLPPAVNGQVHYNTTDNRLYFAVNTSYFSTPVPKWFEFKIRSTGDTYQFNGTAAVQIDSPAQLDSRLDAVELTLSTLGSAAFEDVSAFATAVELDVVEGQAQNYTDALRGDLANDTDPAKGAGLVGYKGRTVAAKLDETMSLADFGGVGDGVANDQGAVQNALSSGVPLRWVGTAGRNFRIEAPVSASTASDVIWYGEGARIVYAGVHAEFAVRIESTAGSVLLINDIEVDGAKLCNKPLELRNLTSMTTASRLIATNLTVRRAKRSNAFSGGSGMLVQGAFDIAQFNQCRAIDCELPAGQGTVGSIGISGIAVVPGTINQFCRRAIFDGVEVAKIYSSDLAYQFDQDGIVYFAPHIASGGAFVESQLVVRGGSRFVNCYGRSIKSQAFSNSIEDSHFERTEGLSSGVGNSEIDSQVGSASLTGLRFSYKNGFQPGFCVTVGTDVGYPRASSIVDNCEVHLDSATTLGGFASNLPRAGIHSTHDLRNVRVFGKVMNPVRLSCNGNRNILNVENFDIQEIVLSANTSDRSMIQVIASGAITPYYAYVTASNNIYQGAELPAIVRDGVSGVSMPSTVSAWGNIGFAEDRTRRANTTGLRMDQIARLGRIGPRLSGRQETGYFDVDTQSVAVGATVDFDVRNQSGSIVFITVERNNTSYAVIASGSTTNVTINAGSSFAVGNAVDPGTNTFRVWSIGDNKIRIFNNDVSARAISVFVMCPN